MTEMFITDLTVKRFIDDLDREIAQYRIEIRARKNVRKFLRKLLRSATSTAARKDVPHEAGDAVGEILTEAAQPMRDTGAGTQAPPVDEDPVANVGDETDGTKPAVSDDPASREDDGADRQQPAPSGLSGDEGEDRLGPQVLPESSRAGKSGAAPNEAAAPAPSLLSRVRAYMETHPDSTVRQCADALGVDPTKVRNTSKGVIVFAVTRSPVHRRADEKKAVGETKSAPGPTISFEPPEGEMLERTAKRIEVAELHQREPWLSPDIAATRLNIPVVNLRIFSSELQIEWAQPRAGDVPVALPPIEVGRTLRDRVMAMHRLHPTWSAGLISKELGCAYGSASTYLAEARRVTREVA